jgi:S-DNA-T family DNA segregation ATPase FtsK/SpoIIIE
MVGKIGKIYGEGNIRLFGYLAYVDLLVFIYPLYKIYKNKQLLKDPEFYTGWLLLLISFILLQTLVVDIYRTGTIGLSLYDFLYPFIGKAGMWLLWMFSFTASLILILSEVPDVRRYIVEADKYIRLLKEKGANLWGMLVGKIENPFFDKMSTENMTTIVSQKRVRRNVNVKTQTVKQKTPRKITHRKRPLKKKEELDELPMLEERPLDDMGNLELDFEPVEVVKQPKKKRETKSTKTPPVKKVAAKKVEVKPEPLIVEEIFEPEPENFYNEVPFEEEQIFEEDVFTEEYIEEEKASRTNILEELKQNSDLMAQIEKGEFEEPEDFELPHLEFLAEAPPVSRKINEEEIDRKVHELLDKLSQFKISGEVMDIYSGPLVTTFEFKPAANVKVSKILNLQDDLAMALRAETIRIQAPIPGRDVVGIEIPNETFDTIYLRDILESELFMTSKSPLTIAMGKDIVGNPFVTDLKKLPHLLIAGTTGSGKSVGINAMILSLLYRNDPDSLKLMLIDPKMLEFSIYNDIPHLITPVITDATKAIAALANMVGEMERRYKMMAESRTKNIDNYNAKAKTKGIDTMPFIVVIIDELADLMMNGGKDVEYSIARLAQMARASGIHLIVATQRPSVDVVTGLIKANLPSRLSYRVGQRIDSKVILDALGADSLLGKGDALFTPPGTNGLVRIHAPWNSEDEIEEIVEFLKEQRAPDYDERYLVKEDTDTRVGLGVQGDLDELYEDAKQIILSDQKTSISYLQRKLQIGYNRSANIIEQLQEMGVLSAPNNKGQREIML